MKGLDERMRSMKSPVLPVHLTFKSICILSFITKTVVSVSMDQEDYEDGILTMEDIQSVKDDLMFDQLTFDDSDYSAETEKFQDTCSNVLDGIEFIEILLSKVTSAQERGLDHITIPRYTDNNERKLSIEETYDILLQLVNDILDQAEESSSSINAAIRFIQPQIDNNLFTAKTETQNKALATLRVLNAAFNWEIIRLNELGSEVQR